MKLEALFRKGEDAISKDNPYIALDYARQVIKGPWEQGEDCIASNPDTAFAYNKFLNELEAKKNLPSLFPVLADLDRWLKEASPYWLKSEGYPEVPPWVHELVPAWNQDNPSQKDLQRTAMTALMGLEEWGAAAQVLGIHVDELGVARKRVSAYARLLLVTRLLGQLVHEDGEFLSRTARNYELAAEGSE
jgi:hypothetical protein